MKKVTINGIEYTPFEAGKTATELGIDTSRKFIALDDDYISIPQGEILTFSREDMSYCAYFLNSQGKEKASFWRRLAYYDGPKPATQAQPKFKVGDKVRLLSTNHPNKVTRIFSIKYDCGEDHYGLEDFACTYLERELELVEQQPLTNTIITDIKDEAQHKRVQEKLLSLGNKQMDSFESFIIGGEKIICWGDDSHNLEKFNNYQLDFDSSCYYALGYTKITASTFLQEKEEEVPKEKFVSASSPLPGFDKDIQPGRIIPFTPKWYGQGVADKLQELKNYNMPEVDPRATKGNNKLMENIVSFFNDLTVSAEDKELRKAGLKNEDLNYTSEAIQIVKDLEAKELGYKNWEDIREKTNTGSGISAIEAEALFTKFEVKLLETAKKFNKRNEKNK